MKSHLHYLRCWLPCLIILIASASQAPSQDLVTGSDSANRNTKAQGTGSSPQTATDDAIKPIVAVTDYINVMADSPLAARPEFNNTGSDFGNNVVTTGAGDLIDMGEGKAAEGLSKMSRAASGFSKIGDVPISEGSALLGSALEKDPVGTVVNVGKVGVAVAVGIGVEKVGEAAVLAYGSWAIIPVTLGGLAVGAIAKSLLDLGGAELDKWLSQTPTEVELKKAKLQASIDRCENDFKSGWISGAQRNKWVETQNASIKQLDALKKELDDFQNGVLSPIEAGLKAIKNETERDVARVEKLKEQLATSLDNENSAPDAELQQVARNVTRKLRSELAKAGDDLEYNNAARNDTWKNIEPNLKKALATVQILKKRLHDAIYKPMGTYYLCYKLNIAGPTACNEGDIVTLTLTLLDPPEPGIRLPPYDFECRVDDDTHWNILKEGTDEHGVKIKREGKQLTIVMTAGSSDTTLHFQVIEKSRTISSAPTVEGQSIDVFSGAQPRIVFAGNSITIHCKPQDKSNVVQPVQPKPSTPPPQPQVLIDYLTAKKGYDQARKQMPPPTNLREISDDYQKKYKAYVDWAQNPGKSR